MSERKYASAQALEQAVRSAAMKSQRDTSREIAGFYRDRLLCRILSEPHPRFILKGGQSQLARRTDARETKDIDLVGITVEIERAVEDLKELAAVDLHDFIDFRFLNARPIPVSQEYRTGMRVEFETAIASWLEPVLRGELARKKWNPRAQRWIDVGPST